jgi:hypothetical protein
MSSWASWASLDVKIGAAALGNIWKGDAFTYIAVENALMQNTDAESQLGIGATKCD